MKPLLSKLYQYGPQVNSHDLIKVIATIGMIVDHVGLYLFHNNMGCRAIGRIAAPLFFFLVGYASHYRFKFQILGYGILLTIITYFTDQHIFFLNILINFVIIKAILEHFDPDKLSSSALSALFFLFSVGILFTASWLEYGTIGLLFAVSGRLFYTKNYRASRWLFATLIVYFIYQTLIFHFFESALYFQIFWVICLILGAILYHYRVRIWQVPNPWRWICLFTSRYSLEIYFFHLSLLKIYSAFFL